MRLTSSLRVSCTTPIPSFSIPVSSLNLSIGNRIDFVVRIPLIMTERPVIDVSQTPNPHPSVFAAAAAAAAAVVAVAVSTTTTIAAITVTSPSWRNRIIPGH